MTLAAALISLLATQESTANPRYQFWADCNVGSWVKMRVGTTTKGDASESEQIFTLRDLTPEQALLDVDATWKGGKHSTNEKVPHKISYIMKPEDREEEITVAGRVLKCRLYGWEIEALGQKSKGKVWMSKVVPGGIVKLEFSEPAGMKMEAVEWEKK